MNLLRKVVEWFRLRRLAAQHRARVVAEIEGVNDYARTNVVRHRNRVERAISMNRLSFRQAERVRSLSRDYIAAYARGRIASIEDVNAVVLDYANRMGAENRKREREKSIPAWRTAA